MGTDLGYKITRATPSINWQSGSQIVVKQTNLCAWVINVWPTAAQIQTYNLVW